MFLTLMIASFWDRQLAEIENSQLIIDNSQNLIGTYSTNKIAVWFQGVVVGALSLDVFVYTTGKAP